MLYVLILACTAGLHRPAMQHQWTVLLLTSAERIDIDTASIQALSPSARRVWLRWDFDLAASTNLGPDYEQYVLERRDFDCASHRTRVIEKRREAGPRSAGSGESSSARELSWQEPLTGSLLAQVLDAGCRLTNAGA
jgi:hypothetical protein